MYRRRGQLLFSGNVTVCPLLRNCAAFSLAIRPEGIHLLILWNFALVAPSSSRIVGARSDIAEAMVTCAAVGMLEERKKVTGTPIVGRMYINTGRSRQKPCGNRRVNDRITQRRCSCSRIDTSQPPVVCLLRDLLRVHSISSALHFVLRQLSHRQMCAQAFSHHEMKRFDGLLRSRRMSCVSQSTNVM